MNKKVITLASICLLSSCIIYIDPGDRGELLHEERILDLEAGNLSQLLATTGAGNLDVTGEEGRSTVELVADIYYYNSEDFHLTLRPEGSDARLEAGFNESAFHYSNNNYFHIDLLVKVPAYFSLDLHDGSGDTSIRDLNGDVVVEDGSGDMLIQRIMGSVYVKDGSGDLIMSDVAGVVTIDDGSGNIDVNRAGGLTILNSGSGGLKTKAINGPVDIDN